MREARTRIGRVTLKDPKIKLLNPRPRWLTNVDYKWAQDSLEKIWDGMDGKCATIVIVAFDGNGYFNRASKIHKDAPWGRTTLPSMVAEVIRRDYVAGMLNEDD